MKGTCPSGGVFEAPSYGGTVLELDREKRVATIADELRQQYGLTASAVVSQAKAQFAATIVAVARSDQANARDLSLDAFLQRIAEAAAPINSAPTMIWAKIEGSIDELPTESPVLPGAFSRADIYADHA